MRARSTAAASLGFGASGNRKGVAMGGSGSVGQLGGSIRGDGFIGGGGPGEPWAKETSVFNFGAPSASASQDEHDLEYCGIEKGDLCIHLIAPVRRVCTDVEDAGKHFLGCAYEGPLACDYVKWIDKRWEGRAKTVIMDLASKNINLESGIKDCEREMEKNKLENRANGRIHKEMLLFRDRIITFGGLLYLGMFAIMFAVIVSK